MTTKRKRGRWLQLPIGPLLMVMVFAALAGSCTPGSNDLTAADSDVVVTAYDPNTNFSTLKSYFMPDSIVHFDANGNPQDPSETTLTRQQDQAILNLIEQNFTAYGYTRVTDTTTTPPPPATVLVSAANVTNYTAYSSYPWWGAWGWYGGWSGYPAGFGPGWGWFYPTGTVVSSYTLGGLFIQMVTPDDANMNDQTVPIVWIAAINGLLTGSQQSLQTRITDTINQAFAQSAYLAGQ